MLRKLCIGLVISMVMALWAIPALAASELPVPVLTASEDKPGDIIYDKTYKSGKQFLVTITRPEGNELLFGSKSYIIRGQTDKENIRVMILKINDKGNYEAFKDSEGLTSWIVGGFGYFTKEIELKEGTNNVRIVAFRDADKDNLQFDVNLQMNDFALILQNEADKEKIMSGAEPNGWMKFIIEPSKKK